MEATELITRFYRGDRDFQQADLQGVSIPNLALRDCDFTRSNLRGATFNGTHISNCDFSYADMRQCQLPYTIDIERSRFLHTDLRGALLQDTQFNRVDLSGALFDHARLEGVWFQQSNLTAASFCGSIWRDVVCAQTKADHSDIDGALFVDCDISDLTAAVSVRFEGRPIVVDFRTVCRSLRAPTLEGFLLSCHVPGVVVTYLLDCAFALDPKMLMSILQSTFISYGSPDEAFARRLRDELHRNGVKTFFFRTDAIPGERLHDVMHDGINGHDRVILICSKASLARPGVRNEIQETLAREARDGGATYLIPVAIDGFIYGWRDPLAKRIRDRVVADFRASLSDSPLSVDSDGLNVPAPPAKTVFQTAVQSLIRALKRKRPGA